MNNLNTLSTALTVLSAMIAPAVLISACASLAISTSSRLARAIDRTRKLLERFEQVAKKTGDTDPEQDEGLLLFKQLSWNARRSKLLHRALATLYIALSTFVATSVALGFTAIVGEQYGWMPLLLGMGGVGMLFYTSGLLIVEARLANASINSEMDFVLRRTRLHASPAMLERQRVQRRSLLSRLRPAPAPLSTSQ